MVHGDKLAERVARTVLYGDAIKRKNTHQRNISFKTVAIVNHRRFAHYMGQGIDGRMQSAAGTNW